MLEKVVNLRNHVFIFHHESVIDIQQQKIFHPFQLGSLNAYFPIVDTTDHRRVNRVVSPRTGNDTQIKFRLAQQIGQAARIGTELQSSWTVDPDEWRIAMAMPIQKFVRGNPY